MLKKIMSGFFRGIILFCSGVLITFAYAGTSSWIGPYAGVSLGANNFNSQWTATSFPTSTGATITPDSSSPMNFKKTSAGIGGYFGYNFQVSNAWIIGLEGDISYPQGEKHAAGIPGCAIECISGYPGPQNDASQVKLGWRESALVRIGYLLQPEWMVYGVAGISRQEASSSLTCQHSGADPVCLSTTGNPYTTVTNNKTKFGWTAGVGFEKQLGGNYSIRIEYDYAHFGSWDNTADLSAPLATGTDVFNYKLKLQTQALNIGLTHRF